MPRCRLAATSALVVVLLGGSAHAAMPDRVAQDDATVVCRWHDRDRALEQMREGGFSHVRINVVHAPGPAGGGLVACAAPATIEDYDRAVAAVRAAGLVPQLTLLWYRQADPEAIAGWMGQMAAHFAGEVQRFSVLNEPDLTVPAGDACDPETVMRMVAAGTVKVAPAVHRYRSWRIRTRRGYRFVVVRRSYRGVATPEDASDSLQTSTTVRQGCLKIQRGRIYRRIFDAAEPAIRAAAPGAQVLAGETSPVAGVGLFIGQALPLHADGWAHHCYQWDLTPAQSAGGSGIGDTAVVQALVGLPLYYTECGYPNPDSLWNQTQWNGLFTHDNTPAAYTDMWQYARDQGVREMGQFGWCQALQPGRWDTSLMAQDDCGASPEYLALQRLLGAWAAH